MTTSVPESKFWQQGDMVVGIDEAGWGPLAGPLFFGGVVFDPALIPPGLNDSKQLVAKRRRTLYSVIKGKALVALTTQVPALVFDQQSPNAAWQQGAREIVQACLLAARALGHTGRVVYLVDGIKRIILDKVVQAEVTLHYAPRLDAEAPSVSAASILAKVEHDYCMDQLAAKYPEYDFSHNSGYGTVKHIAALRKYGIVEGVHRRQYVTSALTNKE